MNDIKDRARTLAAQALLHDIRDMDDPLPRCCADGCPCGAAAAMPLSADETVRCAAIVFPDDEGGEPCGALSRFVVARSDGDESFGINGGSDECCADHLAETVTGMAAGDNVHAIVAIRWDASSAADAEGRR